MLSDSFLFQIGIGFSLIGLSILLFGKKRSVSLFLLFSAALVFGFAVATLDPYLFIWDEQFHALVAKNLSHDMLNPKLYANPVLPFDIRDWTMNHIWVHKQPLFLWQIALSIKCFGSTTLAVRLPSIIMHAILPLLIYRMGKLSLNERIGFLAALLFAVAHYPLELMAGRYSTDHNDFTFLFYVTASFWAFLEYQREKKWYWLIAAGVFSGGAVLTKWLLGLLIYPSWFFAHVIGNRNRFEWKSYLPMALMFLVSCLIFLPWQFYIFSAFPEEAAHEFSMISRHLHEVVEGHGHPRFYFFEEGLRNIYGKWFLVRYALLIGIILMMIRLKDNFYRVLFATPIILVFGLYTYAETKMPSFPVVIFGFGCLSLATLLYGAYSILKCWLTNTILRKLIAVPVLVYFLFVFFDIQRVEINHSLKDEFIAHDRKQELAEFQAIKELDRNLNQKHLVFNAALTTGGHVPVMFYTKHTAYPQLPSELELNYCKRHSTLPIAVINRGEIPDYILKDSTIQLIELDFNP